MSDTQQSQAALLKLPRQLSTFHWQKQSPNKHGFCWHRRWHTGTGNYR